VSTLVQLKVLPTDAKNTALFIECMDQVFNAFNSGNLNSDKKMGHAFSESSGHKEFLLQTLCWLDTVKAHSSRSLPCLQGWKMAIRTLLALFEELQSENGVAFLLTNRLNQDCLENLFSCIRGKGGHLDNPNAAQFRLFLRQAMVDSLFIHSAGSNCSEDNDKFLLNLTSVTSDSQTDCDTEDDLWPAPVAEGRREDGVSDGNVEQAECDRDPGPALEAEDPGPTLDPAEEPGIPQHGATTAKDPLLEKAEKNALTYVTGYLVKKISDKVCEQCKASLTGCLTGSESEILLTNKQYEGLEQGLSIPSEKPCDFQSGSSVVVLFTTFAGTDPHAILLRAAAERNMSVFFGLPAAPQATDQSGSTAGSRGPLGRGRGLGEFDLNLMPAYFGWVYRVVAEHQARYSNMTVSNTPPGHVSQSRRRGRQQTLYQTLAGYYGTDECCLAQVDASTPYFTLYKELGLIVHGTTGKRMAISPFIDLNRAQLNATVERHVQGFETLVQTNQIDIIAVQEGRGAGKGCYYWPTQRTLPVSQVDKTLDKILHYLTPDLKENVTFEEIFTASNQELFAALEKSRDDLVGANSDQLELWLNVEAFEYLRDDPCLPVDPASSGMGEILNRASKNRVDKALTAASVRVQKVISFAWDSDYTCTTNQYRWSLAQEIRADLDKEIIASCSFHSPANKSIVNWPARGKRRTDESFGYYFETAWGAQHNRVPSLIYTQLWDLPNVLVDLDYKGWVSVKIKDGSSSCIFEYDFTHSAA
ncbi:hypothetical protein BaRGS_00005727, partial [Batillaria attramentaria]